MREIIIDAEGVILGRLASFAAEKALLGLQVRIVNSEKALISTTGKELLNDQRNRIARGGPIYGPFYPRIPDRFVRRVIRGMLPYAFARGREAYHRVLCFRGIPEVFNDKTIVRVEHSLASKRVKNAKLVSVGEICSLIGRKVSV